MIILCLLKDPIYSLPKLSKTIKTTFGLLIIESFNFFTGLIMSEISEDSTKLFFSKKFLLYVLIKQNGEFRTKSAWYPFVTNLCASTIFIGRDEFPSPPLIPTIQIKTIIKNQKKEIK